MEKRTVIEKLADGHLVVTKEVKRGLDGNAHQRRMKKREEYLSPWRKEERKIYRGGLINEPLVFSSNIELLPLGSPEIAAQALDNNNAALVGVLHAEGISEAIDEAQCAFKIVLPKRTRIVFMEE